jgi:nucleoside-diphosphate kinase
MLQRTLTIIKPDGVQQRVAGKVISHFEEAGFRLVAARLVHLTREEAEGFYAVHKARPFFGSLTTFMSSGPCIPMVLEGEDAIARLRALMGATDPAKADAGTIRKLYAGNVERNIVHGSDSPESAATEIHYFFSDMELLTRG